MEVSSPGLNLHVKDCQQVKVVSPFVFQNAHPLRIRKAGRDLHPTSQQRQRVRYAEKHVACNVWKNVCSFKNDVRLYPLVYSLQTESY